MPELPEDMHDIDPDLRDAAAESDGDGLGEAEAAQSAADWASSDSPVPAQVAEDSDDEDDVAGAADAAAEAASADEDIAPPAPRSRTEGPTLRSLAVTTPAVWPLPRETASQRLQVDRFHQMRIESGCACAFAVLAQPVAGESDCSQGITVVGA